MTESRARFEYRARLIKVVDADTLHLDVDLGIEVRVRLTVRLHGVNAPEITTTAGQAAFAYAIQWFTDHVAALDRILITTVKDRREKYGRYLAVIHGDHGDRTLNDDLVAAGHAAPYAGGAR